MRHEQYMKGKAMQEEVYSNGKPFSEQEQEWQAVSPKHYKEIVPGMEYMDMMCYMLEDFEGVESHLIGQIYKYLMRLGKKDGKEQEIGKVFWYTCYLMIEVYGMDAEKLKSTLEEIEYRNSIEREDK